MTGVCVAYILYCRRLSLFLFKAYWLDLYTRNESSVSWKFSLLKQKLKWRRRIALQNKKKSNLHRSIKKQVIKSLMWNAREGLGWMASEWERVWLEKLREEMKLNVSLFFQSAGSREACKCTQLCEEKEIRTCQVIFIVIDFFASS